MRKRSGQASRGYSVLELLVAMAIFTVFSATLFQVLVSMQAAQDRQDQHLTRLQSARGALYQVLHDLRLVGYPARNNFSSPSSPGLLADGFLEATPNSLVFEADRDGDGRVERIEYRVAADQRSIRRRIFLKRMDGSVIGPISSQDMFVRDLANATLAAPPPVFSWDSDPASPKPFPNNITLVYVTLAIEVRLDPVDPSIRKIIHLTGAARRLNPVQ
ncbi:MAG: type II secretion system protein J [Acidobacteriota bacterium]